MVQVCFVGLFILDDSENMLTVCRVNVLDMCCALAFVKS